MKHFMGQYKDMDWRHRQIVIFGIVEPPNLAFD
jgi:hypothetical protein